MPKKNNPGCTCCDGESCTLLDDDFDRADSTNIGSNWTEVSGDASISSNKLAMTSGTIITSTVPHTTEQISITVTINGNSSTRFRIVLNYTDSSNYNYVDITPGGSIVCGIRSGGSDSTLTSASSGTVSGGTYEINVCVRENYFNASVGGAFKVQASLIATSGTYGLGMPSVSGSPTFDNFLAEKADGSCPWCNIGLTCTQSTGFALCTSGTLPTSWEVEISGVADDSCTECTTWNDTFILNYVGGCVWVAYLFDLCSHCYGRIRLTIGTVNLGLNYQDINVRISLIDTTDCVLDEEGATEGDIVIQNLTAPAYQRPYTAPIDCSTMTPQTFTGPFTASSAASPGCDWSSGSATITATPIP